MALLKPSSMANQSRFSLSLWLGRLASPLPPVAANAYQLRYTGDVQTKVDCRKSEDLVFCVPRKNTASTRRPTGPSSG